MRLTYRLDAARDVAEAHHWYESQRTGLGEDFQGALVRMERLIQRHPEAFPIVHADVRRALLRRFPYAIYYRQFDEQTWEVIACLHTRRDPAVLRDQQAQPG